MTDENEVWTEQTPDGDTIRIYPPPRAHTRECSEHGGECISPMACSHTYDAALAQRKRDDAEAYTRLRDGDELIEAADLPPSVRRLLR